jgi:hypothetical protein
LLFVESIVRRAANHHEELEAIVNKVGFGARLSGWGLASTGADLLGILRDCRRLEQFLI